MSLKNLIITTVIFAGCLSLFACRQTGPENVIRDSAKVESTINETYINEDSIAEVDCYGKFFSETTPIDSNTNLVTSEGKKYTLSQFIQKENLERSYLTIANKNVDGDSIPELWIRHFTMGAHCCDQWFVFVKEANNIYKEVAQLTGGNICVDGSKFNFTFHEALGYFNSCFACGYNDTTKGFVMMRDITLQFNNGKFEVTPYTEKDEAQLVKNLQILQAEGVQALDDAKMDSGIRKEFAMNFAVYYYNHQKDIKLTKALFDKYYTFKDAPTIWKELLQALKEIKLYSGI